MTVGVVDYGAGNLKSVETALEYLGADFFISGEPGVLSGANRLIFPGVGEALAAMKVLRKSGLAEAVSSFFRSGKPILGICLGCQIVLDSSEEGDTECLGLLPGRARRFPPDCGLKVPHMGWNQVSYSKKHSLFTGIPDGSSFYFVHSYYSNPADRAWVLAKTDYGVIFPSALAKNNLAAVQFHPEKSGEVGLKLLANFLEWKS